MVGHGVYPLHSRYMALFDCLNDDHHQVRFDNLYMSTKFCLGSFKHPRKVMVEGVSQKGSCGVTPLVIQHEVTTKAGINTVTGTVKTAILDGCPELSNCLLVCMSVYNTKPVHLFSVYCDELKWIGIRQVG